MMPFKLDDIRVNYLGINGIPDAAAPLPSPEGIENMNEVGVRLAFRHEDRDTGKRAVQSIICLGLNGPPGLSGGINWGRIGSARLGLFPTLVPRAWVQEKITLHHLQAESIS